MGGLRDHLPSYAKVVELAFHSVFVGDGAVVQGLEGWETG